LLKQLLEAALEGEMSAHLDQQERQQGNRRNGKTSKVVKSAAGEFALSIPRDRSGSFEPQIVPKRQVVISEELEEKVISLYGMGMSFRDIAAHIKEMYSMEISAATLSSITDGPQIRFDLRSKSSPWSKSGNPGRWSRSIPLFGWTACITKSKTKVRWIPVLPLVCDP
jgi:hypothetical protein